MDENPYKSPNSPIEDDLPAPPVVNQRPFGIIDVLAITGGISTLVAIFIVGYPLGVVTALPFGLLIGAIDLARRRK